MRKKSVVNVQPGKLALSFRSIESARLEHIVLFFGGIRMQCAKESLLNTFYLKNITYSTGGRWVCREGAAT
jgi:hypothetical protein